MALSGTVALLLATGIGEQVKEQVPILPRFLQGSFFPLGLVVCLFAYNILERRAGWLAGWLIWLPIAALGDEDDGGRWESDTNADTE